MTSSTPIDLTTHGPSLNDARGRAPPLPEPKRLAISKAYTQDPARPQARRARFWIQAAAVGFCLIYGMAFALFAPGLIVVFPFPIIAVAAVVLWAAPDSRLAPTRGLVFVFYCFTTAFIVWPPYLAFKLGSLPNINVSRVFQVPMLALFGLCLATSATFRRTLGDVLKANPLIWRLMAILVVIEVISPIFAQNKLASIQQLVLAQINWTAEFFLAAYVFVARGRVEKWAQLIWICSIFVGVIACVEAHKQHILWMDHIPSFLQVNDEPTLKKLQIHMRPGTSFYRAQSTFSGSIQFAEFMCLSFPFIANFAAQKKYKPMTRCMAGLSLVFLVFATLQSHSRTGGMGILLCGLLYPIYLGVLQRKRNPRSWVGTFMALTYPAIGGMAVMVVVASGRIRNKLIGGSETINSTQARFSQWQLGLPKVVHNPFGHGLGTSGLVLGYLNPDGQLTIDTYFLSVLLELGVLGFLVYFGMFLYGSYRAARGALEESGNDPELVFLAPAAIALLAFVLSKVNFSEQDNHPLFFITLGMAAALIYRLKKSGVVVAAKPAPGARQDIVRPPAVRSPRSQVVAGPPAAKVPIHHKPHIKHQ